MGELFKPIIIFLLLVCFVFGGISYIINFIARYSCLSYGEITGEETRYRVLNCYQKQDGKWVIIN